MQQIKNLQYKIKKDLEFVMASEQEYWWNSKTTTISRSTIYEILHSNNIKLWRSWLIWRNLDLWFFYF